jgi:FkbM family methyltransferase
MNYSNSSRQNLNSYDTSRVDFTRIHFLELALWNESTELKLHEPLDGSRDSSHSISGIDNNYRRKTNFILVKTTSIPELMEAYKLKTIDLLKLDIEGAALEVLQSTFASGIFPTQIILEMDEMHFPGPKSWLRARSLRKLMHDQGYICIKRDNCDFTFIRYPEE